MRWFLRSLASSLVALFLVPSLAFAAFVPPAHVGYINDYAGVFTDEERARDRKSVV